MHSFVDLSTLRSIVPNALPMTVTAFLLLALDSHERLHIT